MECDAEKIHQINVHLFSILGSTESVYKWWDSPNKYFSGNTPASIYEMGEEGKQQVYDYVMWHSYGSGG